MQVGELRTHFPWGLLLVTDAEASDRIPQWDSDEEQATASDTAVVLRVLHGDEGETTVRVWDDESSADGYEAFDGTVDLPSGTLRIGDALGEETVTVRRETGRVRLRIVTNEPREPNLVDVVIAAG
jgi:hypothetical protein